MIDLLEQVGLVGIGVIVLIIVVRFAWRISVNVLSAVFAPIADFITNRHGRKIEQHYSHEDDEYPQF